MYITYAFSLKGKAHALENVLSFYLTIDDVLEEQSQDE